MEDFFSGIYNPAVGLTLETFAISIVSALILGAVMAAIYCFRSQHSRSFVMTLGLLPATVAVVIMMVNGNLGAGVAVGALEGLVILWIVFIVITMLGSTGFGQNCLTMINESKILNFLYDSNILSKFLLGKA